MHSVSDAIAVHCLKPSANRMDTAPTLIPLVQDPTLVGIASSVGGAIAGAVVVKLWERAVPFFEPMTIMSSMSSTSLVDLPKHVTVASKNCAFLPGFQGTSVPAAEIAVRFEHGYSLYQRAQMFLAGIDDLVSRCARAREVEDRQEAVFQVVSSRMCTDLITWALRSDRIAIANGSSVAKTHTVVHKMHTDGTLLYKFRYSGSLLSIPVSSIDDLWSADRCESLATAIEQADTDWFDQALRAIKPLANDHVVMLRDLLRSFQKLLQRERRVVATISVANRGHSPLVVLPAARIDLRIGSNDIMRVPAQSARLTVANERGFEADPITGCVVVPGGHVQQYFITSDAVIWNLKDPAQLMAASTENNLSGRVRMIRVGPLGIRVPMRTKWIPAKLSNGEMDYASLEI